MNNSAYWAVAFICLVGVILFWLFKIVRIIWKRTIRLLNRAFQHSESSPKVSAPVYSIGTRDFTRIAYKAGYRHPRTEEILVDGGQVQIRFASQSGYSIYDAYASFELSGRQRFGEYSLRSTNADSDVPKHIADKIQSEMRKYVGFL